MRHKLKTGAILPHILNSRDILATFSASITQWIAALPHICHQYEILDDPRSSGAGQVR